jgi:hypothetical protein
MTLGGGKGLRKWQVAEDGIKQSWLALGGTRMQCWDVVKKTPWS